MAKGSAGSKSSLFARQVSDQSDGLDGFSEPHFICEDAIEAAGVDGDKPVKPNVLVLSHCVLQQKRHLRFQALASLKTWRRQYLRNIPV